MARMSSKNYGIIGAGYFGAAVAKRLAESGNDVIVLDKDEQKLNELANEVSSVFKAENITRSVLEDAGIGNCETVVIGMGENIEASILATLNCIEMGIPRVVSKAGSVDHGKILKRLGAEVVFPEEDAGERLANNLTSRINLDFLPLSDDFSIASMDLNSKFAGFSVLDLNWRKKYGINLIAIVVEGKSNAAITPDTVLPEGCKIVISGSTREIDRFKDDNAQGM